MICFTKCDARLLALTITVAGFALVSPKALTWGPDLCLWRHLFGFAACPACGSTRALAAFFHGNFAQALAFNRNVVVTAPLLVGLLLDDLRRAVRRAVEGRRTEHKKAEVGSSQ
jgi:hypothetical protein